MATPTSPTDTDNHLMPVRTGSTETGDLDIGDASDPLYARFKTWRGVVNNLIEFFEQLESMQKAQAKEFTKLSKTLEVPFKNAELAPDGLTVIWQAMRDKTAQMATFYTEESSLTKAGPITNLIRLKGDIKKHLQDLDKEGVQGSKKLNKRMDKFSDMTQSLGKWIPVAETNPTSLDAHHDPYVLHRQIRHKLHKAIDEENALNEQLYALQMRCQHGERLIIQEIQKAISDFTEQVLKDSNYYITVANEINAIAQGMPPEKEWEAFCAREPSLLPEDHKPRDAASVAFPFHDHHLVKPVIEGPLARKSTLLKRRNAAHYVLTPSGFLLEYKDKDVIQNPDPTLSLKLSDCELGNPPSRSGKAGFTIRGKNAGKTLISGNTHNYAFVTDNMEQANEWWSKIEKFTGSAPRGVADLPDEEDDEEESPVTASPTSAVPAAVPAPAYTPGKTEMPTRTASTEKKPITTAAPTTNAAAPATTTARPVPALPTRTEAPASTTAAPTAAPTTTPAPKSAAMSAATAATKNANQMSA